jgi:hypothetical protein
MTIKIIRAYLFPGIIPIAGFTLLLFCRVIAADDEGLPSVLSANASIDDSNSNSFYFDASLALPDELRFGAGGGNNANADSRVDVKTTVYHAGLSTNPLKPVALGIDFERWGDPDNLLSETWRFDLSINIADWSLRFSPAYSSITVYTLAAPRPEIDMDSDSYGVGLGYYSESGWFVDAGYTHFLYSRDVSKVPTTLLFQFVLSPTTLQLLSALDERRYTVSAGFDISDDQVGIDWSRTESALDASYYTTVSLFYSKPFGLQWAVDITVGQQHASYGETLNFASLGVNYFW